MEPVGQILFCCMQHLNLKELKNICIPFPVNQHFAIAAKFKILTTKTTKTAHFRHKSSRAAIKLN